MLLNPLSMETENDKEATNSQNSSFQEKKLAIEALREDKTLNQLADRRLKVREPLHRRCDRSRLCMQSRDEGSDNRYSGGFHLD